MSVIFSNDEVCLVDNAMLLQEVTGYAGCKVNDELKVQGRLRQMCQEMLVSGDYATDLLDVMACALRQYSSYHCRNAQWGCRSFRRDLPVAQCGEYMSNPFGHEVFSRMASAMGYELYEQDKIRACYFLAEKLENLKASINPYKNYGLFQQEEYIALEMALDFVLYKQEQVMRFLGMPEAAAREASLPLTRLQERYFRDMSGNCLSVDDSELLKWVISQYREKIDFEIVHTSRFITELNEDPEVILEIQAYEQHVQELRKLQPALEVLENKMRMHLPSREVYAYSPTVEEMIAFEEEIIL